MYTFSKFVLFLTLTLVLPEKKVNIIADANHLATTLQLLLRCIGGNYLLLYFAEPTLYRKLF